MGLKYMFYLSSTLANYVRREKYFISTTTYNILYSIACIIKVCELITLIALVGASIWLFSFAF